MKTRKTPLKIILFIVGMQTTACLASTPLKDESQICQNIHQMEIHAHRGSPDFPENMLSAFHRAVDQGVDYVELDLQYSADDQLVVAHDPLIKKECLDKNEQPLKERIPFRKMTVEQIQDFDCGSVVKSGNPVPGEKISTLKETMESLYTRTTVSGEALRLNIELKYSSKQPEFYPPPKEYVDNLLKVIDESDYDTSRILIQSFDVEVLKEVRRQRKDLKLSPLLSNIENGVQIAMDLNADLVTPHWGQVSPEVLQEFHRNQIRVIPWTVNKSEEALELIRMGVDGAITDTPNFFSRIKAHCSSKN